MFYLFKLVGSYICPAHLGLLPHHKPQNADIAVVESAVESVDLETDALTIGGVTSVAFTTSDLSKLDGIASGAEVNPTNVSAFTNDAGYVTTAFVAGMKKGDKITFGGTHTGTIDHITAVSYTHLTLPTNREV